MAGDPYRYFRIEARELSDQLAQGALDLEKDGRSLDLVPRLLRLAHTLKGAARVVKQVEIADLAHALEDALAPFRDGDERVPRERIDGVLKLVDAIDERLARLSQPADPEASPAPRAAGDEPFRTVRAEIAEMDGLLEGAAEARVKLSSVRGSLGALERARHLAELLDEQLAAPAPAPAPLQPEGGAGPARLGSLAKELRRLVAGVERGVGRGVDQVDRELRQLRDAAERLRLLPASTVFQALERTVRDTAQAVGRRASFAGKGGEVRLDAHVLGAVQGALVQLVRNAVAHGIEDPAERTAAGKPPDGIVSVDVTRRGDRVAFVCRDDGRGVDLAAVRRAARRRGVPGADAEGDSEALLRLLLAGGISTSRDVTEVSGRGIGLDVVREAASRLGGEVSVRTEAGRGTTGELVVPVSLASLDALIVEAGGQTVAIPLDAVRATLRVADHQRTRTAEGESISLDGASVPFAPLARVLRPGEPDGAEAAGSAVVVQGGGRVAALGVTRLLGTLNLVLRTLPPLAPVSPVVAGASLDGEGNPQLVLAPDALVLAAQRLQAAPLAPAPARDPILVVDDSLTTRMLERSILESAGHAVELAVSGEEALEMLRRRRYRLILVDVEMPGMDGFSFIERLRADPARRGVPAILVTSRNSAADRRRGEAVGADAYVTKGDFDQTLLLEHVRRLSE